MKRDYPEHNPDWLRTEHYAKLSQKENPHGFVCALCSKTHLPTQCPNKNKKKEEEVSGWSRIYETQEESYGW